MTLRSPRPHLVWAELDAHTTGLAAHAVGFAETAAWRPPADVYETADAFHVLLDVAAVEPTDIHVEMEGDVLSIAGVRRASAQGQRTYHVMEIQFGAFERRFRFAHPVAVADVAATYARGFLEVRLPKAPARPAGRREIPIR
jgi:HSP20 family protein